MQTGKDRVRVMAIVGGYRIEGDVHVLVGSRITDALNSKTSDFIALTDARVFRSDDADPLYSPSYLAMNRDAIACIFPLEEH